MRDQDMADVDVTSPGVWERESDVQFEDLKRREQEEQAAGIISDDPSRPRVKGGMLTEQNLKIWLSVVCTLSSCFGVAIHRICFAESTRAGFTTTNFVHLY
jgi:hypothetical protein